MRIAGRIANGHGLPAGRRSLAAACVTLMPLAACQTDLTQPAEAWSTKDQSVLASDTASPRLNITTPYSPQATSEVRAAAVDLLLQAADSTNALLRANSIEALHPEPEHLPAILTRTLSDENRGVRFVSAMTIGKLHLESLAGDVEPLLFDESRSVRAAAIFALARNGRPVDITPLAELLMTDDAEVRANVAMILGEMGEPSALPMLRDALRRRLTRAPTPRARVVELQIAEAMVKLGAEKQIEVIRAALFAPPEQGELTALAAMMCGRLKDEAYAASLLDIAVREGREQQPAEVRLAAALAVAQIDAVRAPIHVPLEYVDHENYAIRSQAASALGWMPDPVQLPRLAHLMEDRNPLVQVSAAGAVLRLSDWSG